MPVKNAAIWLNQCLESIQQQTESEWELIAIDDHSTDRSLAILEQFAAQDSRIKVYPNHQKGIIAALRLALSKSSGIWITRMDADDLMPPKKLALLKSALVEQGEGYIATGLVSYFSEEELGAGYQQYAEWLNQLTQEEQNFTDRYKECVIPSPCWMVHKTDLLKSGAFTSNYYPEDYDLCFRFYEAGLKIVAIKDTLHLWRDHSKRTSRNSETYAFSSYFDLKIKYFLKLDYNPSRPLVIWGAGKKGKQVARLLQEADTSFNWVCNSPEKIGKDIYGVHLQDYQKIKAFDQPQILIVVSAPDAKEDILTYLQELKKIQNRDYFYFC